MNKKMMVGVGLIFHAITNFGQIVNDSPFLIHHVVGIIGDSASCSLSKWGTLSNACLCELIKNVPALKAGSLSAASLVRQLIIENHCSLDILNDMLAENSRKEIVLNDLDDLDKFDHEIKEAIIGLYERAIIIKNVDAPSSQFTQQGNFTPSSLEHFLRQAHKEGKLSLADFSDLSCVQIKDLSSSGQKGANTGQLFLVSLTCQGKADIDYIVKEMITDPINETFRLVKASEIKELDPYIFPPFKKGSPTAAIFASLADFQIDFPIFIFPSAYLSYSYKGIRHVLSIAIKAPGVPLSRFMRDYKEHPTRENLMRAERAYFAVGHAISLFHRKFLHSGLITSTAVHGDFHYENIFFDEGRNQVYLIDNERVAHYMRNPTDINQDVTYLFSVSQSKFVTPPDFFTHFPDKDLYDYVTIYSFIKGYLDAYPSEERMAMLSHLKKRFFEQNDRGAYGSYRLYEAGLKRAFEKLDQEYPKIVSFGMMPSGKHRRLARARRMPRVV